MIQFIILYTLSHADEPLPYQDLLTIVQGNCEINFTDLQLGLDNLVQTGHVASEKISNILTLYSITQKGKYVIDFFYKHIPLIIREPIDGSIKEMYLEKRRKEAIRTSVEPINRNEYNAECTLFNDDKTLVMSLTLYAGAREQAEEIADYFKNNSAEVYSKILDIFNTPLKENSYEQKND